ncbi:MAG: HigA family addiction module antidote protein [Sphingomonadales bacterium]|nr:HigA family addiction module antidote protein [Sphingomonadales bacterium]NCP43468.1 HigA family addiction module antidote protein [Sphingomonadales bacterium]NCQ09072.1 HigA family addiction module antidote protein [Sphingomonadales bacterium]
MAESMLKNMRPIHPGELLREDILPAVARPKAEIARLLGISRQTLYDIINERQPVTAQMALRLAKMFGGGPEVWINMQRTYDLKIAERELGDALDKIPELRAA